MIEKNSFCTKVIETIRWIPHGKVATYGQIAAMAGSPRRARHVGNILQNYSDAQDLPWHRVINRRGQISLPQYGGYEVQRALLLQEGIEFNEQDVIDLQKFGW
ncbi:MAG: MGMT family protein [bacterium]